MKKYIAVLGFIGVVFTSCAQNTVQGEIPSVVLNSFQQKFSNATDIEWKVKDNVYKVEFDTGNNEHEVWIDHTGKIISHKEEIRTNQLPAVIANAIKRDFPGYRIEDADKIDTDGTVTYKVEVDKGSLEWKATYDASGKLLNKIPD